MRQTKTYRNRDEYELDKIVMHNDEWRPLTHTNPYVIEYIKGNEPENQVKPKTDMTQRDFLDLLAEQNDVNII